MTIRREPPRQLPLDLPAETRFEPEDLAVGLANAAASDYLMRWPDWPTPVAVLTGPEASGKSHLAALWARLSGAVTVAARDLGHLDPVLLAEQRAVVVEDAGSGIDEAALFHLINATYMTSGQLLITSRIPPASWGLTTADLMSRLRAAQPLTLTEPDDALLEAVLAKLFADRQTVVDPNVITFLARRMERSFAAAAALVAALDREALADKAPITRQMAQRVLERGFSGAPELPGLDIPAGNENNLS